MNFEFTEATKAQAKARIALTGPAGSGKTFTALTLAREFGGPIAVIDTERGSASKYSGAKGFAFRTLQLSEFDPLQFTKVLAAAIPACVDGTLIIDSYTSWWNGIGGMIEYVDKLAAGSRSGNSFQAWGKAKPVEKAMIDAMLAFPAHLIVTMRSKTEYVVEENEKGQKAPRKIGTAPEQRAGIEYEFDIVGDMTIDNTLVVSKSRCSEIRDAMAFKRPNGKLARMILEWLSDGVPVAEGVPPLRPDPIAAFQDMIDSAPDAATMRKVYAIIRMDKSIDPLQRDLLLSLAHAKGKSLTEANAQ